MEKEALKRIFEFLAKKEQQNPPFIWKINNNIPFTKEELNVKGDLDLTNSKARRKKSLSHYWPVATPS